jgi:hypothetical protein
VTCAWAMMGERAGAGRMLIVATVFAACTTVLTAQGTDSTRLRDAGHLNAVPTTTDSLVVAPPWHRLAGIRFLRKDSTARLGYMRTGDLLPVFAGVRSVDGGSAGSPGWTALQGAPPILSSAVRGGLRIDDPFTLRPSFDLLPTEGMEALVVHPAHMAFYVGRPGTVLAVETRDPDLRAERPFTRVRHAEGPYDYLYTDVMFALDPGPHDRFFLDVTRQTLGTSGTGNPARFANGRAESWDATASWRHTLADRVTLGFRNTYNDNATWQNGGALAWRDDPSSPWLTYPARSTSSFIDTAFNPLLATLVNPTMVVKGWRNEATLSGDVRWDTTGAHGSRVRLVHGMSGRLYSDVVDVLSGSDLQRTRVDRRSDWQVARVDLAHESRLAWAALVLGGVVERHVIDDAMLGGSRTNVQTSLSAMLTTDTGPVHLQSAVRVDHAWGATAAGLGGSARIEPLEGVDVWAGVSASDRAPSPFERYATGARVRDIGARSTANDRVFVTEAGAGWRHESLHLAVRGFANEYRLARRISIGVDTAMSGADALRFTTVFDNTPESWKSAGVSLDARYGLAGFEAGVTGTWTSSAAGAPMLTPRLAATGTLAWRGMLIAGTLTVRAGASYCATSTFDPTRYNPESDWFGVAPRGVADEARTYTNSGRLDLFLFATIRDAATIHLVFVNVLDDRSIQTVFQPLPDRGLRFGVDWTFFE